MIEHFDDSARRVVVHAQAGARELGQRFIGTEHLLLGLVWEGADGDAATILRGHGVTADGIRAQIRRWTGGGSGALGPLGPADAEALSSIGIDLDAVRAATDEAFGPGALDDAPTGGVVGGGGPRGLGSLLRRGTPTVQGHIPLTPRAKKALEFSLREAVRMQSHIIWPGHLLLGLLRAEGSSDTRILTDAGIDLDDLRREVEAALAQAGKQTGEQAGE